MDLVHEAVALLNGTHDFMSFTLPSRMDEIPPTLRNVDISLEPGTSLLSPFTAPFADEFDYWHFVYKSRSFLFRQASSDVFIMLPHFVHYVIIVFFH